jgi:hypothetical protein
LLFQDRVSLSVQPLLSWNLLCGPGWLQTHKDLPASAPQAPGSKVAPPVPSCATADLLRGFFFVFFFFFNFPFILVSTLFAKAVCGVRGISFTQLLNTSIYFFLQTLFNIHNI